VIRVDDDNKSSTFNTTNSSTLTCHSTYEESSFSELISMQCISFEKLTIVQLI